MFTLGTMAYSTHDWHSAIDWFRRAASKGGQFPPSDGAAVTADGAWSRTQETDSGLPLEYLRMTGSQRPMTQDISVDRAYDQLVQPHRLVLIALATGCCASPPTTLPPVARSAV